MPILTTQRGTDGIPWGSSYVPNVGITPVKGSPNINTDSSLQASTAVALALDAAITTSATLQSSQAGNGNGTALNVLGYAALIFTVNMVGFTGTVNFEGSEDGTNYDQLLCTQQGTATTMTNVSGTTTTSIHLYAASVAGLQFVRARTSGVSAGNVTVTAHANPVAGSGGSSSASGTSSSSGSVAIQAISGTVSVQHANVVDAGNSSTVLLPANGVFTGTSTSSLNYTALSIEVFTDQASAAGGLSIQQSQNGTNWDIADTFTISASTAFNTVVNLVGQFYRVVYTNGATGQGTFRLQTLKMVADAVLPRTLTAAGSLRVDGSGVNQPVVQQASGSVSGVLQNAVTANGNGATLSVLGMGTATFTVTGTNVSTFVATVNFQGSEDGINFYALTVTPSNSSTGVTSTTTTGLFTVNVAGLQLIRAPITGYGSGTITVTAHAVPLGGGGGGGGSNASVSTTAAAVPGSATYVGGNKAGNLVGFSLDGSGNLNVNVAAGGGSGGTSSSFGSAFPATGTAIGASDGTNMQGLLVESSSNKNLRVGIYSGANEATVTGANALKVDGSAVTQPVSGTVIANIGTTNGLALDSSVNGVIVAQGSTTSGEKGPLMQGAVTTSAPSYTTAQTSPISLTTAGAVRVDGSAVTQPVSGTITANAGTGPFPVAGMVASGASNANNPVKTGGVFNTTQPTVTNGQVVDMQATARGAAIVATGVDTFNVTVNAALPAGSNTIGAVTQASGPWTQNLTQVGGTNIVTGGASGLIAVGGPVASGASNADNPLKVGGVFNTTQPTVTTGQVVDAQYTARGAAIVATGVDAFAVNASQAGTWTVQPGNTANTTAWLVQDVAATSGGSTPSHTMSAASTNATSLKASAGMVYGLSISNANASARYFKLYNKASAPTVGTDTPILTLQVPGNGTVIRAYPVGLALGTGIAWAATGAITDADTTAIGLNDLSIDIDYK